MYINIPQIVNSYRYPIKQYKTYGTQSCDKVSFSGINIPKHTLNHYQGCLVGGAIGDALGAPVEFMNLSMIKDRYGANGIVDLSKGIFNKAHVTDDTQMTIFTADGLIKSALKNFNENMIPDMSIVYKSYQNWLVTQNLNTNYTKFRGWFASVKELFANRASGLNCTTSLRAGRPGSIIEPINNANTCGGVMRVAPVGLMYYKNPELAFQVGAECAALTHGSPDAYLSAGFHSSMIANIINGKSLDDAFDASMEILKNYSKHEKLYDVLTIAKDFAKSDIKPEDAIYALGDGWSADEVLAISVYSVLKSPDNFEKAVIMAVNHSGDSDSTGAIAGNILGAYTGFDKLPAKWKDTVEFSSLLKRLGKDLFVHPKKIDNAAIRYPNS